MAHFTAKYFVLVIFIFQEVAIIERQIFDFLGYMWAPIIANFFQIIFVIFGFFGIYQFRPKYLFMYVTWTVIWLAWNVFIVCIYLEVGYLKKENNILNMGTGSHSWWEVNGIGCNPKYNLSSLTEDGWKKPVAIDGCLLDYKYIEVMHASIQIILGLMGLIGVCYLVQYYRQKDAIPRSRKQISTLPYSIEYRKQAPPPVQEIPHQKPMTPRKVKRRSTRSKRLTSSYRQCYYQNPVTRIMNHSNQNLGVTNGTRDLESSTSNDSYSNLPPPSYSSAHSALPAYSSSHSAIPAYSSASSTNILSLNARHLHEVAESGIVNPGYQSRPLSQYNERSSPIYMNNSETII